MSTSRQPDSGCGWGVDRTLPWTELDDHDRASVAVDAVVFTISDRQLHVVVQRRHSEPEAGNWALPGGMVTFPHTFEYEMRRHLKAKAGIGWDGEAEPFAIMNDGILVRDAQGNMHPELRDPRGWVISLGYLIIMPWELVRSMTAAHDDVTLLQVEVPAWHDELFQEVRLREGEETVLMAFDHARLIARSLRRLRRDHWDRRITLDFMPETFTLRQLQDAAETIRGPGGSLNRATWRRHVTEAKGWAEPTGELVSPAGHQRRTGLYRAS
jgi:8-oxo-dGTP diphosphatase